MDAVHRIAKSGAYFVANRTDVRIEYLKGTQQIGAIQARTIHPDGRIFVHDAGIAGPPAQVFQGPSTAPSDAEPTSAR